MGIQSDFFSEYIIILFIQSWQREHTINREYQSLEKRKKLKNSLQTWATPVNHLVVYTKSGLLLVSRHGAASSRSCISSYLPNWVL